MARGKHSTALFEVIQKSKGQERSGSLRTPSWWFKRRPSAEPPAPQATAPSPTPSAAAVTEAPEVQPTPRATHSHHEQAPPADSVNGVVLDRTNHEVLVRLSYRAAGVAGGCLAIVLALAYLGGRQFSGGPAPAIGGPTSEQLRQGPANPAVLDTRSTPTVSATAPTTTGTQPRPTATTTPATAAVNQTAPVIVRDANRQIGLNYVIIQSYPREDLARDAVQTLAENGVGATVEQGLRGFNPSWFSVVGIEGFDRPALRSPQFQQYEQRLLQISAQHAGRRSFRAFEPMAYRWDRQ
jgi:hypothetical protein